MKLSRHPSSVIYDLDGVLLDTEHFYTEVTQEIVGEYGKTFDWSIKSNMIGLPSADSARYLVETLDLPIRPQEYLSRRAVRLKELFATALPLAGVQEFTRALRDRGVAQAVATSSERELFAIKTSQHAEWFSLFAAVVCGDDARVAAGKPAPDIFNVAAAELNCAGQQCLVFEDSPAGVQAAIAAGMQVVAIPDPGMDRLRYADADLIIESFVDLSPESLGL